MVKGVSSAALLVVLFLWALASNAEAGRTHEAFAQSTYDDADVSATTSTEKTQVLASEDLPVMTTTTTQDSPSSEDVQTTREASTEHTTPESTTEFSDTQQQHYYRDFRGTTGYTMTPSQGNFMPDARPWWFNPQYASYYPQGMNNQQQQHQSNSVIPNRYPLGYSTYYYNPQFYPQSNNPTGGNQFSSFQGSNGLYPGSRDFVLQQYSQGPGHPQYSQYSTVVPYEMTGGGCPTQYWVSNVHRWPAFFSVKSTVGDAFGTPAVNVFGDTTVLQALLNTRPDGYSTLLRSATTAILNSYSRSQYKFTHVQVMESFAAALDTRQAAAEQAAKFEEENVGAYSEQYNLCT